MSFQLFKSLLHKSSLIQKEIDQEHNRVWPDRFRLIKLKKIRLSIKDKLQSIIFNGVYGKETRLKPHPSHSSKNRCQTT